MKSENDGYSLLELLLVIAIIVIVSGAAIPLAYGNVDRTRAAGAARYVAGRMAMAASKPSGARPTSPSDLSNWVANIRCRLMPMGMATECSPAISGGESILPITLEERLDHHFPGVDVRHPAERHGHRSRQPFNPGDPVQIGSSTLLSFSPTGACTSGTLFIRGLRSTQFAVRVLGATGRTRVFEFNFDGWQMANALTRATSLAPRVGPQRFGMERAACGPGARRHVIDLSSGGALIETDWRLLPVSRQMQIGEPVPVFRVAARVLRCHVACSAARRSGIEVRSISKNAFPSGKLRPISRRTHQDRRTWKRSGNKLPGGDGMDEVQLVSIPPITRWHTPCFTVPPCDETAQRSSLAPAR